MLNDYEKNRYSRHILLTEVGESGQEKLKSAKVLVIGAGGLGCPVLQYLTAAGVGTIGVIDYDNVDETNLQRQILFSVNDIGKNKAETAKERLSSLNPLINITAYNYQLTTKNALSIFNEYDIIVDGTDNFATRYLVNDASLITGKPLVSGSIFKFEGQVSVFNYKDGPSYRCLFPEPPKAGSVPSCSEIGVIGVLPGLIGTQQANEVLKIILGIGKPLSGKLLIYNALQSLFMTLNITRSEKEIEKVLAYKDGFENFDYEFYCNGTATNELQEISTEELNKLDDGEFKLLDVRNLNEQPRINEKNLLEAPLISIDNFIDQIPKDEKVIVVCQKGATSKKAIQYLQENYGYTNLVNLTNGISNWKKT